jgi:NAD(P)H-dependent FMN reductase
MKFVKNIIKLILTGFGFIAFSSESKNNKAVPIKISIIVGSVRATPTGKQIAENIQKLLEKRSDIVTEILYVIDYHLPFYTDPASPASLKGEIVDPILKKWSDVINQASAFIIISPEYNGGYPAGLKNALDSLYKEWNNKPVGIIGYSGGTSGGTLMIAQLKQVVQVLEMIPVATSVKIPQSWKAFDSEGKFHQLSNIEQDLQKMVDELINYLK